jgi:Ni,Fe-hydrogenase I cytochrome b subunit
MQQRVTEFAPRVNQRFLTPFFVTRLDQGPFERLEVFVFLEDRHPSVRSVKNMVNHTAFCGSFWASHATESNGVCPQGQSKVPDTFSMLRDSVPTLSPTDDRLDYKLFE